MSISVANRRPYWGNGHYYLYNQSNVSWATGRDSSADSTFLGLTGYLATVTSSGENNFIRDYSDNGTAINTSAFLGGSDYEGTSEGSWKWSASAAPESGQSFPTSVSTNPYTNWNSGQPNNSGNQDYLQMNTNGYWEDNDPDPVGGFITEWGKSGVQYEISLNEFAVNSLESGTNGIFTFNLDRGVYSDYKDVRNGTALIGIPVRLTGSAKLNKDYTIKDPGGQSRFDSSYSTLYILGDTTSGAGLTSVKIEIVPIANTTWQAPRDVCLTIGSASDPENIYKINGSLSQRLLIYDDEPLLSLGQGLKQAIYTNYKSSQGALPANAEAGATLFDANSINESDSTFDDNGLYDLFATRWEGYVRINETGSYVFRTTCNDGVKLTLKKGNSVGSVLASINQWREQATTSYNTSALTLNQGDVVWVQMDYYKNGGTAAAQLSWDRTPTGGSKITEVIPASAFFLSEALALGRNPTEPLADQETAPGFTLFANQSYGKDLKVNLLYSTAAGSTVASTYAQQRTSSTGLTGDDYSISSTSDGNAILSANEPFTWKPTSANLSTELYQTVYSDIYAESNEAVTLTLSANATSDSASYGISGSSVTNRIADVEPVLSLGSIQHPQEGEQGWVTIVSTSSVAEPALTTTSTGESTAAAGGMRVKYRITGGKATRGSDYLAPMAVLDTTNFVSEDYVYFPLNATSVKLYISALEDAILEGDEEVHIELLTDELATDTNFAYQLYNVDSTKSTAILKIKDRLNPSDPTKLQYPPGVVITPADRTGLATIRAHLVNGQQQAFFDVHLLSQPLAEVSVLLDASSGKLDNNTLVFTASNWDQPQRVTLNEQVTNEITEIFLNTNSDDENYAPKPSYIESQIIVPSNWDTGLGLTLWEGGTLQLAYPVASISAISTTEGGNSDFGFDLHLSEAQVQTPIELFYTVTAASGFLLSEDTIEGSDASWQPERQYNPLSLSSNGKGYANLGALETVGSNGEFSAEAWVRLDATNTSPVVLEFADGTSNNEIRLGFKSNTTLPELLIYNSSGQQIGSLLAANAIALGQWSHLAFSIDSHKNAILYVDGNAVAHTVLSEALSAKSRTHNLVGSRAAATDASNGFLHGAVHDVRIWNGARSQEEIQASLLQTWANNTNLLAAYSLNNDLSNSVGGRPSAELINGASFQLIPFYGAVVPLGSTSSSLRLVPKDDQQAEGSEQFDINLIPSSRYSFTGTSGLATVSLNDNDSAAILFYSSTLNDFKVAETDQDWQAWIPITRLHVSEDDQSATFTPLGLRLATKPTSSVIVTLNSLSYDTAELKILGANGTSSVGSLTFTADNWNVVQQINLQGVDDSFADGDSSNLVSFTVTGSDSAYTALAPAITVTTLDNDPIRLDSSLASNTSASTAPIASIGTPSSSVLQEGSSDTSTFTVSLSAPATSDTLVFLEFQHSLSSVSYNDLVLTAIGDASTLSGLTFFQKLEAGLETQSVDVDGINETAASFKAKGLVGSFKTTWSGFIQIKETGHYSFIADFQGGVKLTIADQLLINSLTEQSNSIYCDSLYLQKGTFVPIILDYQSNGTQAPLIALSWSRPDQGNTSNVTEIVPADLLSRADGIHLLIAKNQQSASFTIKSIDDSVAEGVSTSIRSEDLVFGVLAPRGVEMMINAESPVAGSVSTITLSLTKTDRESITLDAGTVLSFGNNLDASSASLASVTLNEAVTLHRDRSSTVSVLAMDPSSNTHYTPSLVGLVSSSSIDTYQPLDTVVNVIARSNWQGLSGQTYGDGSIQLALGSTNRQSIVIPKGSSLMYFTTDAAGINTPLMKLTLLADLSLVGNGTAALAQVTAENYTHTVPASSPNLIGLGFRYSLPADTRLSVADNDTPGLLISTDAAGDHAVNSSSVVLTEGGSETKRFLKLSSQPTQTVTVYLETNDTSEGLLQRVDSTAFASSRIAFTFSPEDWNTTQAFNIVPIDDNLIDGTIGFKIKGRTLSSDNFYNIRDTGVDLNFSNADNDQARLKLELVQTTLSKGGNGFLTLKLSGEPTAPVTVLLTPSDSQFTINNRSIDRPETLTFTAANWSVIQQVELRSVDDANSEDISSSQLKITTVSTDLKFNNLPVEPVIVDIVDNDPPIASVQLVSDSSEEAQAGRFRITLATPAPSSAGSVGVLVNYEIFNVSVDPGLGSGYVDDSGAITKISQSPGSLAGTVRIAPGQSSSDVFVVPIDDFVADSFDKSFQVKLSTGAGYLVSSNANENMATVTIVNNDKAGLIIITSGSHALATEGQDAGTFLIALQSQPKNDVTINLSEYSVAGASRQLHASEYPFKAEHVFDASNWFVPQEVSFWALDDNKIEDQYDTQGKPLYTGLHNAQIAYQFISEDTDYDSVGKLADDFTKTIQVVDIMDRPLSSDTASSIDNALTSLQEGVDSLSLPLVGSLEGKTGQGIRKFLSSLVNSISAVSTPSPRKLAKLIADGIGIAQDAVSVEIINGTDVELTFKFSDSYSVFSVPLAADFGLPGLGFKSEGSLDADFSYDAMLDLVFPLNGDIYLNTDPSKTFFDANFTTKLSPGFKLTGGLGFLQMDAVNKPSVNANIDVNRGANPATQVSTGLDVNFTLDVSGTSGLGQPNPDYKLTLSELTQTDFESLFRYSLAGDAAMSLGMKTSVSGSSAIPSFSFDLASVLPLFDYSNQEKASAASAASNFYFDNIRLDLGSYITDMLSPIVGGIDNILNPIYPIVDALYADTKIFKTVGIASTFDTNEDGIVSPIDLADWFATYYAILYPGVAADKLKASIDATITFVDLIKGVMDLVRNLDKMAEEGSFYVDYGGYVLPAYEAGNADSSTPTVTAANTPDLAKDTATQANNGGTSAESASSGAKTSSSAFSLIMKELDALGFKIPIIDDPTKAINLLLGKTVDLFSWTMPEMGMSSEISQDFYIYPGIDGIIEGGFGVNANIGFGFDTYGLNEWAKSGFKSSDAWKVFEGFYIADGINPGTPSFQDVPEFTMDASMGAGLGLSAVVTKASITGGLEASASFDLLDEGEVAGTSDGKIRGQEIINRLDTPLELFSLIGDLSAYLNAKVQVGIDMGFYSTWDTVWDERLATIPLFEFSVGGSSASGTASSGYISGGTVYWDGNSNGRLDSIEPWTTVGKDSNFNLRIDNRSYDKNGNSKLEPGEGRLVLDGGIDTSTGLALSLPMVAPYGQMITPLTTLYSFGLELGYFNEQLDNWIATGFNLANFDVLSADPVLQLRGQTQSVPGGTNAQRAYLAHIKIRFAVEIIALALQPLMPELLPNSSQIELALVKTFVQNLLVQDTTLSMDQRLAMAGQTTADNWSLPLEFDEQLSSSVLVTLSSDQVAIRLLVGDLVADASWQLARVLNKLALQHQDASGADFLAAVDFEKTKAFSLFQKETKKLADGLFAFTGDGLASEIDRRLGGIHASYLETVSSDPVEDDAANSLLPAAGHGWSTDLFQLVPVNFTTKEAFLQRGHRIGLNALDFILQQQDASLIASNRASVQLDLGDLFDNVDVSLPGHSLSFFTGATQEEFVPFIYDPNTQTGARFFNLASAGQINLISDIAYVDGGLGDSDQLVGSISDPSILGLIALSLRLQVQGLALQIGDTTPEKVAEKAAVFCRLSVQRRSATSNQIGYLILADGDSVGANGLPDNLTPDSLLSRYQVLLTTLESQDVGEQSDVTQYGRDIQVANNDRIVLFEIQDGILADIAQGKTSVSEFENRLKVLSPVVFGDGPSAVFSSSSGLIVDFQITGNAPGLPAYLARQQNEAPLLDFTGMNGNDIYATLQVTKEASYQSLMGFYRVLDVQGSVLNRHVVDSVTGQFILPGQMGYRESALYSLNLVGSLSGLQGNESKVVALAENGFLAPYAVVSDPHYSQVTYFGFADANPDFQQHFQMLGDAVYGFEDLFGGGDRDFDDKIVSLRNIQLGPLA